MSRYRFIAADRDHYLSRRAGQRVRYFDYCNYQRLHVHIGYQFPYIVHQ